MPNRTNLAVPGISSALRRGSGFVLKNKAKEADEIIKRYLESVPA